MAKIGYALLRPDRQQYTIDRLKQAGCKSVFTDNRNGSNRNSFNQLLNLLKPHDTLMVLQFNQLGHSLNQLIKHLTILVAKMVTIKILEIGVSIEPRSVQSTFVGYLGDFYYDITQAQILARQASLVKNNTQLGRRSIIRDPKKKEFIDTLMTNPNYTVDDICRYAEISRSTYFNYKKNQKRNS